MLYSLGKKIKSLRKDLKLKQEDLSCEILSRSMISKIENDRVTPSIYQLYHISKKLGVSIEYFLKNDFLSHIRVNEDYKDSLYTLFKNENYLIIISKFEKNLINIDANLSYLFYIGYSYYKMHYYLDSSKILNKFIKIIDTLNDENLIEHLENASTALNILSLISIDADDPNKGIKYLLKAKDLLQKNNLTKTRTYYVIINNIGSLYNKTNNYEKCINSLEEFLSSHNDILHIRIFACIHLSLNSAYYNVGSYDKSIEHIRKAIFFFEYINDSFNSIDCYINYINSLRYSKKYNDALNLLDYVVKKYSTSFDSKLKLSFIMQKAILQFNIGNYQSSLDLLVTLNIKDLDSYNRNCYYFMKGHISFISKEFESAHLYFKRCENFFINSGFVYDLNLLYEDLYGITCDKRYEVSLEYLLSKCENPRKNILIS